MNKHQHISREEFELTLRKMPALDKFISNLIEMNKTDKSKLSITDLEKLYFENAFVFPGISCVVPANLLNKIKLYRVRNNIDYKIENINSIKTYSYPPVEYCKENGRGNLQGAPVFYCGHTYFTALRESKIKKGDTGYLSIWNINATRNCEYGSFLPEELPQNNPWKGMQAALNNKGFNNNFNNSLQLKYLYQYVADLFINENTPYSLTSWLANKMLYGYDFVDFIVYPSFELKSTKCNLAFHPAFVDEFIGFEKVYLFKTIDVTETNIAFQILFVGRQDETKINWDYPTEEDEAFLERK